jgi:hypothetical protein
MAKYKDELTLVKVKNKPNELKAVAHLGKYTQHKGLFDEVVKTLDWLDEAKEIAEDFAD